MRSSVDRELGEISQKLTNIEKLLKAQNGRVSKLEDKVDNLRLWRASLIGVFAMAGGVVGSAVTAISGLFR